MTRKEKERERLLDQIEQLKQKAEMLQRELEKERDDLVLGAIRTVHLTREQGDKLAKLIKNPDKFALIMEMELLPPKLVKGANKKESEETVYEDKETKHEGNM